MRAALTAFSLAALAACCAAPPAMAAEAGTATLSRGAYLAKAGDCGACHTATPQSAPFAGGLAMNSPFGIIYSTNITPDKETGIGNYTQADFERALRHGVRGDGARLYPAMPFASFAALTDADVADLYAYFRNEVAPVRYRPPATALPFPFSQRWTMALWDALFVKHAPYQPRSDRDAVWNRGAYLVQTLGHCGACHTPHGPAYEERGFDETAPLFLTGAELDHWYAADLSGNRGAGIGRLSEAELVQLLRTGRTNKSAVFGSMVDVVTVSTQYLSEDDLTAIARYLKSLPARGEQASYRPAAPKPLYAAAQPLRERPGAGIYAGFCARCHGADGAGKDGKYPALAGNPVVMAANATGLARLVLQGGDSPATGEHSPAGKMPPFDRKLSDSDIADVLTYVRSEWGNSAGHAATAVAPKAVARLRATLRKEAAATQPKPPPAAAVTPPPAPR